MISGPRKMLHIALGAIALATMSAPLWAHHSFAMFDNDSNRTLKGTVKEFRWSNPHVWLQVIVKDTDGKDVEWSLEGQSPSELTRRGWKRTSINAGESASVVIHPLKSGAPGGSLVSVEVNGQPVGAPQAGRQEGPPKY